MYSDIDLQWTVAVADFGDACRALATHLTRVGEVEALRTDPLTGGHPTQRLIFFRVAGLTLFWRVDLEILSADHDPRLSIRRGRSSRPKRGLPRTAR